MSKLNYHQQLFSKEKKRGRTQRANTCAISWPSLGNNMQYLLKAAHPKIVRKINKQSVIAWVSSTLPQYTTVHDTNILFDTNPNSQNFSSS